MNWDWVSARSSSADVAAEAQWLHHAEMADIDGAVAIKGVAELVKDLDAASRVIVTSAPANLAAARQATIGLSLAATMVTAGDISKGSRIRTASSSQNDMLRVPIADCLIFEDSPAGAAAARAAGAYVTIFGDLVQTRDFELAISSYL